ncbi:NAD(P)-dependent oxidoreductase [Marinospirillum alkaliphilum]|uniref:3-hydroxyisobutyrate dehydrogenase n=1 Tax=Marinospirillum alkaliphilum DSM 21637 TaxID=1122209 RepID=A0A1K1XKN5_9GAMM|nr:NAD(P)-dependent oxidoreductase [Marinospirillum alkaliphilum]SFX50110.1 3-hydroxyisobutyrate dehydrogenase [Marinospirillum alkaliphilum DSM 21637]
MITAVSPIKNVGFVGIGLMGTPMSRRLLQAGFNLFLWNRTRNKAEALVSEGAHLVTDLQQLPKQCDVICLCLADTQTVEQLLLDENHGLLPHLQAGQLIIDFSSIAPEATRKLAAAVQERGCDWIDAPVSGGVGGAEQGQLAIMCGGSDAALVRVKALFEPLARQVTVMGPAGSGQVAKVCNQMLVSCNAMVIAEVMALAEAAGIHAERLPQAFAGGFADSLPLQLLAPRMAKADYSEPRWKVRTLLKDLDLAGDLARDTGRSVPMSGLAAQLMRNHAIQGMQDADPATLVECYRIHQQGEN